MTIYSSLREKLDDLDVLISELLVATADGYDPGIDDRVTAVLQLLRRELKMDVVFVSEFVEGERVFRFVEGSENNPGIEVGDAGPLEESYCQRVVQGRMPEVVPDASAVAKALDLPPVNIKVGGHMSTPVVLPDGRVYGTLCCFSAAPNPELKDMDLARLRQCAKLVARKVDIAQRRPDFELTQPDWSLVPIEHDNRYWRL